MIEHFLNKINDWQFKIKKIVKECNKELNVTKELEELRKTEKVCWICKNEFTSVYNQEIDELIEDIRVLDHDH